MTERGMIFNAEMVRAVLDGSKTQTRRILTPRQLKMIDTAAAIGECYPLESGHQHENSQSYYREWCPFGAVGDRLYVRETHSVRVEPSEYSPGAVWYRESDIGRKWEGAIRWTPSIHMPRWASRITLEITGVRVERLTALSDDDARNEGCPAKLRHNPEDEHQSRTWFRGLWSEIYGADSWQANPWVWVIEFKRVEGE